MTSLQKDGLVYATGAVAGALLAKSFGAKVLGLAMGGSLGVAIAAWTILNKSNMTTGYELSPGRLVIEAARGNPHAQAVLQSWGSF